MFEIYRKKNFDYLTYTAVGCAVASYFITLFFAAYLRLNEILYVAAFLVPTFIYNAIMSSDHRTRTK